MAKALQTKNLQALERLRALREIDLPATRKRQIEGLIESTQTYSVFLEDLMGQEKGGSISEVEPMLSRIHDHCVLVGRIHEKAHDRES
jgi:hypothetical protein